MRWLVTAGGTREPIDAVRVLANLSTGRLGAAVADAARAAGHEVLLLHAGDAATAASDIARERFVTTADLQALLARHAPAADVVVHAAAVADYLPSGVPGKIDSERDELVLRLHRAPKLIDALRDQCPHGLLVGFKLTAGEDEAARLARAREQLERTRVDAVVVNDVGHIGWDDHEAVVVGRDGEWARCRGKQAIAARLVELAQARARALP